MNQMLRRTVCMVLVVMLVAGVLPQSHAAGFTNDALTTDQVRQLLNAQPLHPQVSGYTELDQVMAQIMAPYENADTYTKVKAAYDWVATQVHYTWNAYSQNYAPAYNCFVPVYDLSYDDHYAKAMPWEMCNRTYHVLTQKNGICYDYAAAFVILARFIGIDAYLHTGMFTLELT